MKKKIPIPIYHGTLVIYIGEDWSVPLQEYSIQEDTSNMESCVFDSDDDFVILMKPKTELYVIAHECVHLTNAVFKSVKASLDLDNDEPYAYLLGWFFEQIYETIKLI